MRSLVLIPMLAVALILGCSSKEDIRAESAGATGSGGHRMQGAGGGPSSTATATGTATTGAGGSGAGSCCAEPVHVAGHVKTITADTDAAQLVTGTVQGGEKIADGPFVLTDAHAANGLTISLVSGGDCSSQARTVVAQGAGTFSNDLHGARVFAPAGSSLCLDPGSPAGFNGFKPY